MSDRSGLVRRLITSRRALDDNGGGQVQDHNARGRPQGHPQGHVQHLPDLDSNEDLSACCSRRTSHKKPRSTRSWLPIQKRKSPADTPLRIPRTESLHRITQPLPPIPKSQHKRFPSFSYTLRNNLVPSDSNNTLVIRDPTKKSVASSALCSTQHGRAHSHSSHPSHSSQPTAPRRPPRPKHGLGPVEGAVRSAVSLRLPASSLSSISSADHSQAKYSPSCYSQSIPGDESKASSSDSVDKLIRQTDEAFRVMRSVLGPTRRVSQGSALLSSLSYSTPASKHSHSNSMPLPTSFHKHSKWRDASSTSPSPRSSPDEKLSVTKQRKSKLPHRASHQERSPSRAPRWPLTENMTDILTGQRFKKIEADEMLTPERMEAVKRKREEARHMDEERLRYRQSSESVCSVASDNSDTSLGPFHLDELASRISAANMRSIPTALQATPPPLVPSKGVMHQDRSPTRQEENRKSAGRPWTREGFGDSLTTGLRLMSPLQTRNPPPAGAEAHILSPIPEVIRVAPVEPRPKPTKHHDFNRSELRAQETEEFVYLKSTPFTLTRPEFRHGPIAFSKSEMGMGVKTMDDTLDWTAFQMAILGGAGDLFQDDSCDEDILQMEELSSWLDSFGLDVGEQVYAEDEPPSPPMLSTPSGRTSTLSTITASSTPSTINTDVDLPIPVGSEFPSGFWNVPTPGQPLDKAKFFNSTGLKRRIGDGRPRRPISHSSIESLPPSPMMPLVVHMSDGEKYDTMETVPMGYNLGHDLGDFLRWEAENVYVTSS